MLSDDRLIRKIRLKSPSRFLFRLVYLVFHTALAHLELPGIGRVPVCGFCLKCIFVCGAKSLFMTGNRDGSHWAMRFEADVQTIDGSKERCSHVQEKKNKSMNSFMQFLYASMAETFQSQSSNFQLKFVSKLSQMQSLHVGNHSNHESLGIISKETGQIRSLALHNVNVQSERSDSDQICLKKCSGIVNIPLKHV